MNYRKIFFYYGSELEKTVLNTISGGKNKL